MTKFLFKFVAPGSNEWHRDPVIASSPEAAVQHVAMLAHGGALWPTKVGSYALADGTVRVRVTNRKRGSERWVAVVDVKAVP